MDSCDYTLVWIPPLYAFCLDQLETIRKDRDGFLNCESFLTPSVFWKRELTDLAFESQTGNTQPFQV